MRLRHLFVACLALWATGVRAADLSTGLILFENGQYERAHDELKPLAESGDSRAQFIIGIIYLHGHVEPPEESAAVKWITMAAEQEHAAAQSELARMYRLGDGVPQDSAAMVRWYTRAADRGDVGAQLFLADAYAYGQGVEPDLVQAYMWYEIAIQYWGSLAVRARDIVSEKMTDDQVAKATQLAGNWIKAHAK